MATDVTIDIKCRTRGMWRITVAKWLLRWRNLPLARLACWLVNGHVGIDTKVVRGRWARGPRARMRVHGDG